MRVLADADARLADFNQRINSSNLLAPLPSQHKFRQNRERLVAGMCRAYAQLTGVSDAEGSESQRFKPLQSTALTWPGAVLAAEQVNIKSEWPPSASAAQSLHRYQCRPKLHRRPDTPFAPNTFLPVFSSPPPLPAFVPVWRSSFS